MTLDELPPADQAEVDAAMARVEEICAADPELVHGDVVERVAVESPLPLAVALCQQAMGFIPDTVRRRIVESEFEDTIAADRARRNEQAAVEGKAQARSAKAAATRAATAARENAENAAKLKSNRCDRCFQVRTPAGTCGCD
jgi:hypothetical protein